MPHHFVSITPRGKLRELDADAIAAGEGLDQDQQIREILSAQHGDLGGISTRTLRSADGTFVLHHLFDPDHTAERNPYAEGVVNALDGSAGEIRGAAVLTAASSAGLTSLELSLIRALYDGAASRL